MQAQQSINHTAMHRQSIIIQTKAVLTKLSQSESKTNNKRKPLLKDEVRVTKSRPQIFTNEMSSEKSDTTLSYVTIIIKT